MFPVRYELDSYILFIRTANKILRKLYRDLSAIETWCERWNTKINEYKTQAIYFSHRIVPPEAHLTLNGRNITHVNHISV
jgi:hypothetical protein